MKKIKLMLQNSYKSLECALHIFMHHRIVHGVCEQQEHSFKSVKHHFYEQ